MCLARPPPYDGHITTVLMNTHPDIPDAAAWARIAELAERIEFTLSEQEL